MITAGPSLLFHLLVQNIHISSNYAEPFMFWLQVRAYADNFRWKGPPKAEDWYMSPHLFSWFYHKGNEPCSFLCSTFFLEKSFVLNEFLDVNKWELWYVLFCITIAHLRCTPWWIDWLCLLFIHSKGVYCTSFIAYSSVWSSLPSGSHPLIGGKLLVLCFVTLVYFIFTCWHQLPPWEVICPTTPEGLKMQNWLWRWLEIKTECHWSPISKLHMHPRGIKPVAEFNLQKKKILQFANCILLRIK